MKTRLIFATALLAAGLISCETQDRVTKRGEDDQSAPKVEFFLNASTPGSDGDWGIVWPEDAAIGIFDDVSSLKAKEFALQSGAGETTASFKGKLNDDKATSRTLGAIWPVDAFTAVTAPVDAYPLTLAAMQDQELSKYFHMWARASTSAAPSQAGLSLEFKHAMAMLVINIDAIPAGETLTSVTVAGSGSSTPFATTATIDLSAQTPLVSGFGAKVNQIVHNAPAGTVDSYRACVALFPQDFSAAPVDLEIRVHTSRSIYRHDLVAFGEQLLAGEQTFVDFVFEPMYGDGGFEFTTAERTRLESSIATLEVMPVRGEVLASVSDPTPYTFTQGGSTPAGLQLRIWFIAKRNTTQGSYFALNQTTDYKSGFLTSDIVSLYGPGSGFAGGTTSKIWNDPSCQHYFLLRADAQLYNVFYQQYNIANADTKFTLPSSTSFEITGHLGGESVGSAYSGNKLSYNDITFPVKINCQLVNNLPVFIPTASETARPGDAANTGREVIVIRSELLNSTTDLTPFKPATNVVFGNGRQLRIWFITKKGFTVGSNFKLDQTTGYTNGFLNTEVTAICGAGSTLGGGNANKNCFDNLAMFDNPADNNLYYISYALFNMQNTAKITGPAGVYAVPCYIYNSHTAGNAPALPYDIRFDVPIEVVEAP